MAVQNQLDRDIEAFQAGRQPARLDLLDDAQQLLQWRVGLQRHDHRAIVNRREVHGRKVAAGEGDDTHEIIGAQRTGRIVMPKAGERSGARPQLSVTHGFKMIQLFARGASAHRVSRQFLRAQAQGRTIGIALHAGRHHLCQPQFATELRLIDHCERQGIAVLSVAGGQFLDSRGDEFVGGAHDRCRSVAFDSLNFSCCHLSPSCSQRSHTRMRPRMSTTRTPAFRGSGYVG